MHDNIIIDTLENLGCYDVISWRSQTPIPILPFPIGDLINKDTFSFKKSNKSFFLLLDIENGIAKFYISADTEYGIWLVDKVAFDINDPATDLNEIIKDFISIIRSPEEQAASIASAITVDT